MAVSLDVDRGLLERLMRRAGVVKFVLTGRTGAEFDQNIARLAAQALLNGVTIIDHEDNTWKVTSQTDHVKVHLVTVQETDAGAPYWGCTCQGREYNGLCSHIAYVRLIAENESGDVIARFPGKPKDGIN